VKFISSRILQSAVVLIGIAALAFLLLEPRVEGRNLHATFFQIYFTDPFLAYAYFSSIPLFVALYQAFKVLGRVGRGGLFSQATLKSLRTIKICAMAMIGFVVGGEIYIMFGISDDRAGGVFMGALIALVSTVMAAAASMFEGILQDVMDRLPSKS